MVAIFELFLFVAILGFFVWVGQRLYRQGFRQEFVHELFSALSVLTGILTYGYFMGMDVPDNMKIMGSIVLGIIILALAAVLQRREEI